ncbi:MAG TPA: metallophosphoesterase [Thermoanaerobaculia bacterium]|nr:metallophosphoesterase [Thermoanaerobaculia bacterium]
MSETDKVAIIADAHLGGPGGAAAPLVEQLRALPAAGCSRLLLLGDLFQLWIGDRRYETADIALVAATLAGLRRSGIRVDYVEGNRDFFLAGSAYRDAFDSVGGEIAFTAGGTRYLAVHGDGLDRRDRKYRFWRAVSKSRPSRLAVSLVPRRFARRLVFGTERKLSGTNLEHKRRIPEAVLRDYGRRRLAEGHDVLLLGHFHEARTLAVPGGEVRLVDAWFERREVEWLS